MTLSADQIAFFDTFGYLRLPGLLVDRIEAIIAAFHDIWDGQGGGHNGAQHDNRQRSCTVQFIDRHPVLCALLDDPRIHGIACDLLGDDFNYMNSDGNFYSGDTGWHSDSSWLPGVRHLKMAFYLDPLTPETGALRIIPGSHRVGDRYADQLQAVLTGGPKPFGLHGSELPFASATVRPGDLLIFNHDTKHASFGGGSRRRMFTVNLCQRYPEERLQELRDYVGEYARFWVERNYGAIMVDTATPQRMRHLEQVMANDHHLAELSRRSRAAMREPART
ncbi:MAG: phytanoyl-CoA dioxygenase family protein [Planctomycetes bacterium]|nr:phytanoyl-CoA dioxygenase family protein [Planctomycetota bacterium]